MTRTPPAALADKLGGIGSARASGGKRRQGQRVLPRLAVEPLHLLPRSETVDEHGYVVQRVLGVPPKLGIFEASKQRSQGFV